MLSTVLFVVCTATLLVAVNAAKLPAEWKTCPRNLPQAEYDACLSDAITMAVKDLCKNGLPSLNIPPIDPLKITKIGIGKGNGPVSVDLTLEDVELVNVQSLELKNTRFTEIEKYRFGADVVFKKPIVGTAKYDLDGKVLVLPIRGQGDCKLQFDNPKASLDVSGEPFTKGGKTYMNVTDVAISFETDKLHIHLDNLFDGNKELGDKMNVVLNENWEAILKEIKPAVTEALSLAFKNTAKQIINNVPYNQIFPPS